MDQVYESLGDFLQPLSFLSDYGAYIFIFTLLCFGFLTYFLSIKKGQPTFESTKYLKKRGKKDKITKSKIINSEPVVISEVANVVLNKECLVEEKIVETVPTENDDTESWIPVQKPKKISKNQKQSLKKHTNTSQTQFEELQSSIPVVCDSNMVNDSVSLLTLTMEVQNQNEIKKHCTLVIEKDGKKKSGRKNESVAEKESVNIKVNDVKKENETKKGSEEKNESDTMKGNKSKKENETMKVSEVKKESDTMKGNESKKEKETKKGSKLKKESETKKGSEIKKGNESMKENETKKESETKKENEIKKGNDDKRKGDAKKECDVKKNEVKLLRGVEVEQEVTVKSDDLPIRLSESPTNSLTDDFIIVDSYKTSSDDGLVADVSVDEILTTEPEISATSGASRKKNKKHQKIISKQLIEAAIIEDDKNLTEEVAAINTAKKSSIVTKKRPRKDN